MKTKIGILLFLALIIIFPTYSIDGAKQGLLLWFNTVLPTLLPFIILSNLIIKLNLTKPLSKVLYPILHILFGVSKEGCYPVLIGFLSGIPVGAKSVNDLYIQEKISYKEATYLLGFCNNASPMFIMSYIAIAQLKHADMRFAILLIINLSAILSVRLYLLLTTHSPVTANSIVNKSFRKKSNYKINSSINHIQYDSLHIMDDSSHSSSTVKFDFALFDASIMNGFEIITKVGGYIILFSIPAAIITNIIPQDSLLKYLSIGVLEITTGIHQLNLSNLSEHIKIVLTVGITALGGLSGLAQTKSVINESRLSIFTYFKMKVLSLFISLLLTNLYLKLIGF